MNKNSRTLILFVVLSVLVFVPSVPPTKTTLTRGGFVIADWEDEDAYGQSIESFELYENSTGSWVQVGGGYPPPTVFDWYDGSIKILCYTWFNSTLAGASDIADGKNYQRHNVTVEDSLGSTVFSKQGFTYVDGDNGIDPPMWFYSYEVILDFVHNPDEYYTVTINYDTRHSLGADEEVYTEEVQADGDDCWWNGVTKYDNSNGGIWGLTNRDAYIRWIIEIPEYSDIVEATFYNYDWIDNEAGTCSVNRIDDDDVPDLEALGSEPTYTSTNAASFVTDGSSGDWNNCDITDMLQDFIDLATYASGNYFGVNGHGNPTTTLEVSWQDYQYSGTEHAWINVTYQESTWHFVGTAQAYFDTPTWESVNNAIFVFPVGWDPAFTFGYNSFFIFLGLIMIPASTMYLARGGRKEMSANKLFNGLILLIMGIGLLIGGVMP